MPRLGPLRCWRPETPPLAAALLLSAVSLLAAPAFADSFPHTLQWKRLVGPPTGAVAAGSDSAEASGSLDFDVNEWREEADTTEKKPDIADPSTRQFKLDETDRIALEEAKQTLDSVDGIDLPAEDSESKAFKVPKKQEPGKLPESVKPVAASSQDAAADMLKKFFNNR